MTRDERPSRTQLWYAGTSTPYGNPGDTCVLVADTKEDAARKARIEIAEQRGNYVPRQQRLDAIDIDNIEPVVGGVIVLCPR